MGDGGKGSAPRPLGIDWNKFEENWDAIFGNMVSDRVPDGNNVSDGARQGNEGSDQESPEHKPSKRGT